MFIPLKMLLIGIDPYPYVKDHLKKKNSDRSARLMVIDPVFLMVQITRFLIVKSTLFMVRHGKSLGLMLKSPILW